MLGTDNITIIKHSNVTHTYKQASLYSKTCLLICTFRNAWRRPRFQSPFSGSLITITCKLLMPTTAYSLHVIATRKKWVFPEHENCNNQMHFLTISVTAGSI